MTDLIEHDSIKERAKKKLERDMGPRLLEALHDPKTVEILLNEDGSLWIERQGQRLQRLDNLYLRRAQGQAILETVAGYHGKEVKKDSPLLEGEFPIDGSRFAGQLGPVVRGPVFAIRKKAIVVYTLTQYVESEIMTAAQEQIIRDAVAAHKNILVIGGTGSGKTTLVNAIIQAMVDHDPLERFVIIEDIGEIQCKAENYIQYHTSIGVSMTMLLKTTLRMRPDRILVGEVRGEEALDLLDAWNTGHPGGAATLHANSAAEGLTRLKSLVSRNMSAPSEIEPLIGEAVHVVVHIAKTPDGSRRIQGILGVSGYVNGHYKTMSL